MDTIRAQLSKSRFVVVLAAGFALAASACTAGETRVAAAASPETRDPVATPAVTDSSLPMHVLLARFRRGLPVATSLDGGAPSMDALVGRFVAAVEGSDTAAIALLAVSRAEYAWLYFPTSVYARPPYELPPDVAWMLSAAASEKGLTRVIHRLGGRTLQFQSYACEQEAREGANRFWRGCTVEYRHPDEGLVSRRLFGTVMERDGQYKFLSYANDF